jgi:hypothetical protein
LSITQARQFRSLPESQLATTNPTQNLDTTSLLATQLQHAHTYP